MNKTDPYQLFTLNNKSYPLIHDVVVRQLEVNSDDRGNLVEVLKTDWEDIYHPKKFPFTQVYHSSTNPGLARDIDRWHFHPGGQVDRYTVISGEVVIAIYDIREKSPSKDTLNLFVMGESQGEKGQFTVLVPPQTLHGFVVVSKKPATLLNFPNKLYDPNEEWRLPFEDYPLPDGSIFSWKKVKQVYQHSIK